MTLYIPLFRACTTKRMLLQLHAHLLVTGLHRDAFAATKLIDSYAEMASIDTARLVFDNFSNPDSFMWGVLIKGCVWSLLFKDAISLYHEMQYQQLQLSSFVFSSVVRACSGLYDETMGRMIHGRVIKSGFEFDAVVGTSLLHMYGEGGSLEAAHQIFDGMSTRDVVSWSSIVSSCVQCGQPDVGLKIFSQMNLDKIEPDSVVMFSVTEACADLGSLRQAKSVHGYIVKRWMEIGELLENSLIAMYSKCGGFDNAEKLFRKACRRSATSWTSMISCYNQRSCYREALGVYVEMQKSEVEPNSVTMMGVLLSCTQLGCLREGKSVHGSIVRRGIDPDLNYIGTSLIYMYAGFRKLGDCHSVFEAIQKKTVVSWNSLITVYAQNGYPEMALTVFVQMQKEGLFPDSFTLASSLSACGHIGDAQLGTQIHGYVAKIGVQLNEFVQNSLIDMYCKSGLTDVAYRTFDTIEEKDIVTWNTMMSGFLQNGNSVDAVVLFDQMHSKGVKMDMVTFLTAIQACSHLGSLAKGRWIHHKFITSGLKKDTYIDTALINMYGKCGDIRMARRVFDSMLDKNVVSWSSIISSYGIHGLAEDAISLFSQMIASGIRPNEVTFMSILSACSHAGFVEEGTFYFDLMRQEFSIEPQLDHCTCMVDLLSRAGLTDRAYNFINSIPIEPNSSIWGALLHGCHIHHRTDLVGVIQRKILKSEPYNTGHYILISNAYAEEGKWDEFGKVRTMMKDLGMRKQPGYSTVEMNSGTNSPVEILSSTIKGNL